MFATQQELLRNQYKTAEVLEKIQQNLREIKIEPNVPQEKEKSMNSTQPLFYGTPNENVDLCTRGKRWLFPKSAPFRNKCIKNQFVMLTCNLSKFKL